VSLKKSFVRLVKAYDIRGTYGLDLFDEDAYEIGLRFGSRIIETEGGSVVVARDGRYSSFSLSCRLISGLLDSGVDVYGIGAVPSPVLYYSVLSEVSLSRSGIMVTASHNPKDDNGFKFILNGSSFFGDALMKLFCRDFQGYSCGKGVYCSENMVARYVARILQDVPLSGPSVRIAADLSGGAVSFVFHELKNRLNIDFVAINAENDPEFGAHPPDPSDPKNLKELINTVKLERCDFGVAFDGDGDRLAIVDETGAVFLVDKLLAVLAKNISEKNRPIIGDLKLSDVYFKTLRDLGLSVLISKTGHSYVKELMSQSNASFAGEMSGHIFFNDVYYGYDDAIYAFVRFLDIFVKSGKKCSALSAEIQDIYVSNEHRNRYSVSRAEVLESIEKIIQNDKNVVSIERLDGIKARFEKGWILFRMSNTQDFLSFRVEGTSENDLLLLEDMAKKIVGEVC
jgi:phosphomannomutase